MRLSIVFFSFGLTFPTLPIEWSYIIQHRAEASLFLKKTTFPFSVVLCIQSSPHWPKYNADIRAGCSINSLHGYERWVDKMIMKQVLKPLTDKERWSVSQWMRERKRDRGRSSLMAWFLRLGDFKEKVVWRKQQRARSTDPELFRRQWERECCLHLRKEVKMEYLQGQIGEHENHF